MLKLVYVVGSQVSNTTGNSNIARLHRRCLHQRWDVYETELPRKPAIARTRGAR